MQNMERVYVSHISLCMTDFLKGVYELMGENSEFVLSDQRAFSKDSQGGGFRQLTAALKSAAVMSQFIALVNVYVNKVIYIANGRFVLQETRSGIFRGDVY